MNLPDIVDILGPRPYPFKESVKEYLSELRTRKETEAELSEQEKRAEEARKVDLANNTKFDVDADDSTEDKKPTGDKPSEVDAAVPAADETAKDEPAEGTSEDKKGEES